MSDKQCREIFARLSEYLDGDLPADLCELIEGHMDGCSPCQAFLRSLERTVKLIGADEAAPMPEELRLSLCEAWRRCLKKPE